MTAASLIAAQLNLVCFQEAVLEVMVISANINFNAKRTSAMHIFHTRLSLGERCLDGRMGNRVTG